jgi:hypothetical protein
MDGLLMAALIMHMLSALFLLLSKFFFIWLSQHWLSRLAHHQYVAMIVVSTMAIQIHSSAFQSGRAGFVDPRVLCVSPISLSSLAQNFRRSFVCRCLRVTPFVFIL